MMLPVRRPTSPMPLSNDATAKAHDSPSDRADTSPPHLDYDHRPLRVESLSHYTEPVADGERFRVH